MQQAVLTVRKTMPAGCHAFGAPAQLPQTAHDTPKACRTRGGPHAFAVLFSGSLFLRGIGESMAPDTKALAF